MLFLRDDNFKNNDLPKAMTQHDRYYYMNATFFPFFAVSIWALNTIISKLSVGIVDASAMAFYRWFFAFLVLTPFVMRGIWQELTTIRENIGKIAILGLLRIVIYQSIIYLAVQTVPATTLAIFGGLVPILILLCSTVILRTPLTIWMVFGFILAFCGVLYLSSKGDITNLGAIKGQMGELLLLLSSTAYALYTVLVKKWNIQLTTWRFLYLQIGIGILILLPIFLYQGHYALSMDAVGLISYAAIPASLLAPYFWLKGVEKIGANCSALFLNLTPLLTISLAVMILKEPIHHYFIIGAGFIILGMLSTFIKAPNIGANKSSVCK